MLTPVAVASGVVSLPPAVRPPILDRSIWAIESPLDARVLELDADHDGLITISPTKGGIVKISIGEFDLL